MAVILSAAMILAMMPAMVFAEGGPGAAVADAGADSATASSGAADSATASSGAADAAATKNIIVFGDSTSMGFGAADFSFDQSGFNVKNNDLDSWTMEKVLEAREAGEASGRISNFSHPWRTKLHIADSEFGGDRSKVHLTSMCMGGMRTDELRGLLDPDFCALMMEKEKALVGDGRGEGFLTQHTRSYVRSLEKGGAEIDGQPVSTLEMAQRYTISEVEKADVIVVDVCTNNFGTYIARRLLGAGGADGEPVKGYEDSQCWYKQDMDYIVGLPDEVKGLVTDLTAKLKDTIPGNSYKDMMIDGLVYSFADCLTNIAADVQLINKYKKKDAKVIVVGLYNTLDGIDLTMGEQLLRVGTIGDILFGTVSTYLRTVAPGCDGYYFADISEGLETYSEQMSFGNENSADGSYGFEGELAYDAVRALESCSDYFIDRYYDPSDDAFRFENLSNDQKAAVIDRLNRLQIEALKIKQGDLGFLIENAGNPAAVMREISDYAAEPDNNEKPSHDALTVLNTYNRFIFQNGIGQHPSANGCLQKSAAVIAAYESDKTALETSKEQVMAELEAVLQMLRNTGARDDIDLIIRRLNRIQQAMTAMETVSGFAEEYRAPFEDAVNQTMALLGLTTDDLMKQAQAVLKSLEGADIEKLAESLKLLEEYTGDMPHTTGDMMAELRRLQDKAAVIREMIEEAGLLKSNDLLDKLKVLAARLEAAETKEDYMKILAELTPLGEDLLSVGTAVAKLPEYKAAVDEYMYVSKTAISNLEGRMAAAEKQLAMLSAMSVDSAFSTKVTISGGKAVITLTLSADNFADGYTLILNGKEVRCSVKSGKVTYKVSSAKIGTKYKFSLTPYVVFDDGDTAEKIYGNTTEKTVTPKVSLKKVTLRSVKGGKKSVTAKWARVKGADGYKISCKTGGKTKTVFVKGGSKVSKKIAGLTSGKKYTIRVRAYKTVNGKKYYGKWSASKKAKAK